MALDSMLVYLERGIRGSILLAEQYRDVVVRDERASVTRIAIYPPSILYLLIHKDFLTLLLRNPHA